MPGQLVHRTWQSEPTIYAPAKHKRACAYDAFIPDELAALPLRLDATLAGLVSEAELAIRTLNTTGGPALAPLARLLLRTESIASSRIEGMQMDVRALARAEAHEATGRKTSASAREILANIDAMVLAVEEATSTERFAITNITAIHARLMAGAPSPSSAGTLRTQQNWIGGNDHNPCGAAFVPPPPEHVLRLLDDLCTAINDDRLPPLIQAALVHAQFETIHPFDDGNGRTGRALIQVVLRRRGLVSDYLPPLSITLAAARDRYLAGLTAFRADGVEAWIELFADATARATHLAQAYLRAVGALTEQWRAQLSNSAVAPRAGAAAWVLMDVLPAHPIITAPVAAAVSHRAKAAIYQAIDQLQQAGILIPITESRRNQAWEAVGLLDLIEGLEAGQLPSGTSP